MATDDQIAQSAIAHIDTAWHELTLTTDPYPTWVRKGYPSSSHWAHAQSELTAAKSELATIPPPTIPPPPGLPQQGFSPDSWFVTELTTFDQQYVLSTMRDLANGHDSWARIDWWPNTPRADAAIAATKAAGLTVMGLWNLPYGKREAQTTFANHAAQLAGSVELLNVHNEPDMSGWPAATAAQYSLACYTVIKTVNPSCTVVGPSLWKTPTQNPADMLAYARAMLQATNGARFADVWDVHLYDDPNQIAPTWNNWDWTFRNGGNNLRVLLDSYPEWKGTPIMCTEAGTNVNAHNTAYQQACVVDGMAARDTLGLASFGVYTILNTGVSQVGFGLLDDSRHPRPAYGSFKAGSRG
jgi:hypothetical protein